MTTATHSYPTISFTRTLSLNQCYTSNISSRPIVKPQVSQPNIKLLTPPTTEVKRRKSIEEYHQDLEGLRKVGTKSIGMLEEQMKCVKELVATPRSPKRQPVSPKNIMQKL